MAAKDTHATSGRFLNLSRNLLIYQLNITPLAALNRSLSEQSRTDVMHVTLRQREST
jgi:hypothetical protein